MRKIYIVIVFFIGLFLTGLIYFVITIDKSFQQQEKVMIKIKHTPKATSFQYYIQEDTLSV
ncbi:hypothetical protein [Neptunitalea lumnitzerae]|uniref:Uncharacterized protein n=1 Tax=Neptunitalea lumnitzerae TaxID=2965509 RepID=A0ABQ5MFL5_9FLAO|nr:hypothetical protein [Neptunitalea sp. Y10]GLB48179.1 hypothetical protein Y10_05470 [Neptunitalea sp. Y10]